MEETNLRAWNPSTDDATAVVHPFLSLVLLETNHNLEDDVASGFQNNTDSAPGHDACAMCAQGPSGLAELIRCKACRRGYTSGDQCETQLDQDAELRKKVDQLKSVIEALMALKEARASQANASSAQDAGGAASSKTVSKEVEEGTDSDGAGAAGSSTTDAAVDELGAELKNVTELLHDALKWTQGSKASVLNDIQETLSKADSKGHACLHIDYNSVMIALCCIEKRSVIVSSLDVKRDQST
eukprot:gene1622-33012_t